MKRSTRASFDCDTARIIGSERAVPNHRTKKMSPAFSIALLVDKVWSTDTTAESLSDSVEWLVYDGSPNFAVGTFEFSSL